MELTAASRLLLAAFLVLVVSFVGGPSASDAQRIVSFPSQAGYETGKARERGEFPRREELLQALDFLEEYDRGKGNDWNKDIDTDGALDEDLELNNINLEDDDIYPPDSDLNRDGFNPEYTYPDENRLDIPPWLAEFLLRDTQRQPGGYLAKEPEALWDVGDEELLDVVREEEDAEEEAAEEAIEEAYMEEMEREAEEETYMQELEEEAEEEAYMEELEQEEEEGIADIVEDEMENMAVDDILDDVWAEDVLQQDAEEKLHWLLIEEDEKIQREEEEDEEDPFKFEYYYSDSDVPASSAYDDENGPSFMEGAGEWLGSDYADEDILSSSVADDYPGESLDEEGETEELMEEAEEILEDKEEEKARGQEKESRVIMDGLIGALTREAIQEELDKENEEAAFEEDEVDGDEVDGESQSSSILDAGMEADEAAQIEQAVEEEVEQEVYSELIEFLEDEIDQAIDDVAGDILEALAGEEEEEEDIKGDYEEVDYKNIEDASNEEDRQEVTQQGSRGSQVESDDGDVCTALQYFIDDCNIVNNYADLGADGYKDLFTGPCNRHQLCYACGEYYDVGTELCDELFKAEMLAHCEADDTDCKQRAKYFWLVVRNNRITDLESPPICSDPCLLKFLVEV